MAFPTETVYGLGANAGNPAAVAKIFAVKGRPLDHPLIVHLADAQQMKRWARDIPSVAWRLAERFWPGPLTLILKRAPDVLDEVTGGQDTIGLRVPAHPIAHALLAAFGGGVAAPSANRFGRISPTQAEHVRQELGDAVDLILDGGDCEVGIESTIVDISSETPRILRLGSILPAQLTSMLHALLPVIQSGRADKKLPRVSGMLKSHYAPLTPLEIVKAPELPAKIQRTLAEGKKISVLARSSLFYEADKNLFFLAMPEDPALYAHELYAALRKADAQKGAIILVEAVPVEENWLAIGDRLKKAAAR